MTTSLAEQLQHLAVPQTNILTRDKKRPSLLFDSKEAASLKRDIIYQIGLEGLEELILKNEVFKQFKDTLFHITSKSYERSVQDSEANNVLNKNIKKLLLLLSPYFSLNCTYKVLEWLINRYMINEYNREELLMLALPYHETNIFVKIVQLLQFRDQNDLWYFLKPLKKSGLHLPKKSLLNHAATNVGFLKFVTKFIAQLIKVHPKHSLLTVAFNFYSTMFCGAIEYSDQVNEAQVTQMLPLILKGLNSKIADFCAASYVILARLVAKTTLSSKLLDIFVNKISTVSVENLRTEALLVLLLVYQCQNQYKQMPTIAVVNLCEKEWLPHILQELNKAGCYIYQLLEVFLKHAIELGIKNDASTSRNFIIRVLDAIKLDDSFVSTFLCTLLDNVSPKLKYSTETKEWLSNTIQILERQYPEAFDSQVYNILSKSCKRKKVLQRILKISMNYDDKFGLFEKLYHPQPELRAEAIRSLMKSYDILRDKDKELIKNSFKDRLNDDSAVVVFETLKVVLKSQILEDTILNEILIKLIKKNLTKQDDDWKNITNVIFEKLCVSFDWNKFLAVFPYLLPANDEQLKIAKDLLKYPLISEHPILKTYKEKLLGVTNVKSFTKTLIKALNSNEDFSTVRDLIEVLKAVPINSTDVLQKYVSCILLTNILPQDSDIHISSLIMDILKLYIDSSVSKSHKTRPTLSHYMQSAIKNKLPVVGCLQCISVIVQKTKKIDLDTVLNLLENSYKFLIQVASIFINHLTNYKEGIEIFLQHFCQSVQEKFSLLLNISTTESKLLSDNFKINSLSFIQDTLLNVENIDIASLTSTDSHIIDHMLILLCDIDKNVRLSVLNILSILVKESKKPKTYCCLLEDLLKCTDEIIMDNEQVPCIISKILTTTHTKDSQEYEHICNTLVKHSSNICMPLHYVSALLTVLSQVSTFNIFNQISLVPIHILDTFKDISEYKSSVIIKNLKRIEPIVMESLIVDSNIWSFVEKSLRCQNIIETDDGSTHAIATVALKHFTKEVITVINDDVLKQILDIICETTVLSKNPELLPAASRIFKHMDLDCDLILDLLIKMRETQSSKLDSAKRRRIGVIPTLDILETLEWKKGLTLLEFIQDKKKIRNVDSLLPILFDILKKCLDFEEQAAVEYIKQLILSLILHCCGKISNKILPESMFSIELIVQCIRASQNPITHHHALLVLANTAELVPRQVLHHIITIFTFIGSSVLRYDDAYSFQIISKIIDTIIPILVKDGYIVETVNVLRVFVDAILDIPEHRKMYLYTQLLNRIGAKENLHIFLLLIFESHVSHSSKEKQKSIKGVTVGSKRLEIAANLCYQFTTEVGLISCGNLLKYLIRLPEEKEENMALDVNLPIFNISNYTPKQFRHYKYTLLVFISNLLSSKAFINQVALLNEDQLLELEGLFKDIIINILTYIQRTSKILEKSHNTPQVQYWKVILHHSYDILDGVNALLTPQMFLLVTKGLMVHNLNTVKRRALELLNTKLQHNWNFFVACDKNDIYSMIPPIISIVEVVLHEELQADQEVIVQTALLSLKLLVRALSSEDPEKFVQILEFITTLLKSGKANSNVLASIILCLAELCMDLKAHAISCLPTFMPPFLRILRQQKHQDNPNFLLLSIVTTVQKLLDSLPLFLSPYLEKILYEMSVLTSKWGYILNDQKLQPLVHKLANINMRLGSVFPPRILIPSITKTYVNLKDKKLFTAIKALMDILCEHLTNLKGTDINAMLTELTNFFLNALQFRCEEVSLKEANEVEEHVIKSFVVLVLKLSESSFRPLYYKLYDWAVRNEVKSERVITYYSLSFKIAESLKGLFVLFADHFINHSAKILDSINKTKSEDLYFKDDRKNILLLEYLLKTLDSVFKYDNHKFINKDRFEILMQPLVDHLENPLGDLSNRNRQLLTPCLVNLTLAVGDDALWKQMNYQILLKMRHVSSEIRLAALHCLTEVVKKLGEDFLPLLPETIPFLAELLEDEDESVEKSCQTAVQEMEKVLGESLQKYF